MFVGELLWNRMGSLFCLSEWKIHRICRSSQRSARISPIITQTRMKTTAQGGPKYPLLLPAQPSCTTEFSRPALTRRRRWRDPAPLPRRRGRSLHVLQSRIVHRLVRCVRVSARVRERRGSLSRAVLFVRFSVLIFCKVSILCGQTARPIER
jgi:hypothetical protein